MIQKLFLFVSSLFFKFFPTKEILFYTFLFTALGLGSGYGQTNTWTGTTSTAWNTATNWSLNAVPIAAHDVVIPNVTNKPIISGVAVVCNNLTINAGSSLTVSESLTVSGTTSVSGTLTVGSITGTKQFTGLVTINSGGIWNNTANSAIDFRGGITNNGMFTSGTGIQTFSTNAQSLVGSITINSVTITGITLNNSGALTIATALLGTGTLINSSGNTLAIGGTCSINTLTNAGTTTISGAGAISTALSNFVNTGILNLNGSGTIAGITNNAGGTVNLSGSGTITSFNNAAATSILQITAASPSITTLTATIAGNTVNYSGASQTIKGTTYNNLILSGSGTKTLGAITTVSGNWSMTAGTLANLSGFTNTAGTLVLGGAGPLLSSWGSTTSGATNTTNDYFTGTGRINVSSAPYPAIDNNYASYTSGVTGQVAGTQGEYANPPINTLPGSLTLSAPAGSAFINVKFASYGSPGGTSPNFTIGSCHAFNSRTVTTGLLGQNIATIPASGSFNATFGDPCYGIVKSYNVVATYAEPFCTTSGVPAIIINGSTPTGGNGTYSYLWEKSTTGHSTGYAAAPGTNNAKDYTVPVGTSQTTWFRRTVTSGIYSDATIVIVQVVTGPPTVPTTFTSVTSCSGTTTLSVSGGALGGLGGYVEFATGSCGGTVVGTSNSIPATLVVSPTVDNTIYYVRYKNACGNTTCLSTVATNAVSITAAASATAVCFNTASQNASLVYTATTGIPNKYSIVWDTAAATAGLINQTDSSFAFVATGGTLNTIAIPANVPAGTYTGILTVKNGSGCVSFKNNFTVTINPKPTVTNSSLTQTICSGGNSALVTLTSGVAGTTFAWTATATAGVSGFTASGTSTIPVQTISTTGTTQGTVTYVITPTANGCPGASTNYTILVNPVPTITNSPLTQTICSGGSSALVTLTSGVAGTTFAWTATATAGVSGFTASGTSTIPVQTISTTGTTQGTITYVITPTANGCPGTSTNYTILVNPKPTVTNSSLTQTICSGGNSALVTLTSGVAGTTFVWTASATAGVSGFTASGTSTIPVQTISTTGTTQGTVTYVITPTANGCPGTSTNYTIVVNPVLSIPTVGTITNISCITNTGSVVLNGLPGGSWTINQSGTATASYSSNTSSYTVNGLAVGSYTFKVTNANGCPSLSTGSVSITDASSTTWNGVAWSNGAPDATKNAIIVSVTPNSPFTADLSACALTINNSSGLVTIPSGITLTITNGITVSTDYNLVFENNASLVQINNATNTGKIIYKRNSAAMKNFDYTYWSSPVAGQTLFNLSPNTLSDKYMSFSGTGWQISYGGTAVMQPGIGYIIRTPKNGTWPAPHPEVVSFPYSQPVQFKGVPNNGNITSGQSMIKDNFYLIGNPYPSALFADDFLSGNNAVLNGTIYLWTHNTAISSLKYTSDDYASYNGLGGVATSGGAKPSGYIAAGQSFFASAKANGNAAFNNSMRAGGNNNAQFFKPGKTAKTAGIEKHRLWLDMTNTAGAFKQTLIGYAEGATNNFDDNFDGLTFDGNSYLDLYSINGPDNLTIQGRALPFVDTDLVPLGYRSTVAGSFTIAINQADGILANQRVYLEDKQTNTINDLTAQNYTFSTTAGTFNNRFVLRYTSNTLGTGGFETVENSITVLSQDKMIIISSPKENIDKVFIYDVSGKQLYKKQSVGHVELSIQHLPFAQQVLLVKVVLENGYTTTKKLIFK
jgi:hypothetical protein